MKMKTVPVFLAFLAMGFGDVVGPLVGLVKDSFTISNFMAQLVTFSGFLMFGVLSVPMGVFQDRKGKKFTLELGLVIAFIGLLLPVLNGMYGVVDEQSTYTQVDFYVIILAIFLLGSGATILQVAGNPIMRDVSEEGNYSSNLSLAQSIKAIGSSLGFLIPPLVLSQLGLDWSILFPTYAVLILVTLFFLKVTGIQEKKTESTTEASLMSSLKLFGSNGYVALMVMAIFLYVGAEVSMSSGVPILLKEAYGMESFGLIVSWALFFLPILLGRFVGSAILRKIPAKIFLMYTVLLAILGILMLLFGNTYLALTGVVFVGLGFANIFPLVFSITIDAMPERTNELSGLMVTAIVGGAFIPPIMGLVADNTSSTVGFVVPLAALVYIAFTAFKNLKKA